MINKDELDYELYRRDLQVDTHYYRAVTGSSDSCSIIYNKLTALKHGFSECNVSLDQFKNDYEFGKFPYVKDWIRFYADKGLMLPVSTLYRYVYEVEP